MEERAGVAQYQLAATQKTSTNLELQAAWMMVTQQHMLVSG